MTRNASVSGLLLLLTLAILLMPIGGCFVPNGDQGGGGGYSGSSEPASCVSCRGSGRCNTCNGTGRFLGSGETGCSTCSGTGVCINCGGRGQ